MTSTIRTRVVARETLIDEVKPLVENILKPWLQNNTLNFANVIMVCMNIVETYSVTSGKLASADKLAVAKAMIPSVLSEAVKLTAITQEQADSLQITLNSAANVIDDIIAAYCVLSQNPAFIQMKEEIEEQAAKCWASCKSKCK